MVHSLFLMNKLPIHKNLNTSFVDLSALVRHLRSLQFAGLVQIELSSYEAEIEFAQDGSLRASEQDHIAGRLSLGDAALQRIMIRSKEPGGVIHVFKRADADTRKDRAFVDEAIAAEARKMASGPVNVPSPTKNERVEKIMAATSVAEAPIPKPTTLLNFETAENWSELLDLISELMQTLDATLARGNINFADAFRNACGFVSFDHPFLDPDSDVFSYSDGYISVRQRLATRDLIAGIAAALARIMQRLREDPYFGNVYHQTMHRIRVLANQRKLQFDTFGLGHELQKITGI
jgi:hypothetical protein